MKPLIKDTLRGQNEIPIYAYHVEKDSRKRMNLSTEDNTFLHTSCRRKRKDNTFLEKDLRKRTNLSTEDNTFLHTSCREGPKKEKDNTFLHTTCREGPKKEDKPLNKGQYLSTHTM